MNGQVVCEQEGALARVCLSHPGKLNAMSRGMWRQLKSVFEALQADAQVRCIWIYGEAGQFCAGGDISEYPDFRFTPQGLADFHENDVWGGLSAMLACDVPIVAQIEGVCMGAGVEIASCADLRLAGASSQFGAPIAKLGFPMAPRELDLVLREAGALTTRQMLLQAAVLDAQTLLARGFLSQVCPDVDLAAAAHDLTQKIMQLAPQAARMNKSQIRALNRHSEHDERGNIAIEKIVIEAYQYSASAEHREGIAAFLEKRRPKR